MEALIATIILNFCVVFSLHEIINPGDPIEMLENRAKKRGWHDLVYFLTGVNLVVLFGLSFKFWTFLGVIAVWFICGIAYNILRAIFGPAMYFSVYFFPVIIVILEVLAFTSEK